MNFISTKSNTEPIPFSQAMIKGLAPDGGLYVPEVVPRLPDSFWGSLHEKSLTEIGFELARPYIDDMEPDQLKSLITDACNFKAPLVHLAGPFYILELFHGPTLAFKDFGARFMARIFSAFRSQRDQDVVILAATSGDTGSAVASGFLGVEGFKVCLLYPSGKVSKIQEQQLTTAGQNVLALEVEGTFDDCQRMVKQAFTDSHLNQKLILSSANSINIARLLPQSFYYAYALGQLNTGNTPVFVIPSGNFGNLTAGLLAHRMGMPAERFVAATNINDVVPEYLRTGEFQPKPSRQTMSNAMDIGNPSNFERIRHLLGGSWELITQRVKGASFSDEQTRDAIRRIYLESNYVLDPHTAVGLLAAEHSYYEIDSPHIILSTAHPAKFRESVEPLIGRDIPLPDQLAASLRKEKQSVRIKPDFDDLKSLLLENYQQN